MAVAAGRRRGGLVIMRVLFDITHPAQVHFFGNVIRLLRKNGHQVVITTREKDVAISLLKALGMEHLCLSREGTGLVGMAGELLQRYARVLAVARAFQPDVMVAEAGVSIGLVGLLLGIPRVVFESAEHARLQQVLGLPFATSIFTDITYRKQCGARHRRFRGVWVYSHLAPQYFKPDPARLRRAGVDPDQPYIVLRTVAWSAAHDIGLRGSSHKELQDVVNRLAATRRYAPSFGHGVVVPRRGRNHGRRGGHARHAVGLLQSTGYRLHGGPGKAISPLAQRGRPERGCAYRRGSAQATQRSAGVAAAAA